jgi:hypothetical protein
MFEDARTMITRLSIIESRMIETEEYMISIKITTFALQSISSDMFSSKS